jgi:hypothetical protein
MGRPRSKNCKNLPNGLYYRKDRKSYELRRTDGSTISLGHNIQIAITQARDYNEAYRVPAFLRHPVQATKADDKKFRQKQDLLDKHLIIAFDKLANEKKWEEGTFKNNRQWFARVYSFFKSYSVNELDYSKIKDFFEIEIPAVSNDVHNRYLRLIDGVFDYLVSDGVVESNEAKKRKRLTQHSKSIESRHRLSIDDFKKIHQSAIAKGAQYLAVAMELSLQTSHAVLEVSKLRYSDVQNGNLLITRQKNKKSAASRVSIPFDSELAKIFEKSKLDNIISEYVVHYRPKKNKSKLSSNKTESSQLSTDQISRKFSTVRDQLGLFSDIIKNERPTFHDIRAISINLYNDNGYDPQDRAAHSSPEMTKLYTAGHEKFNIVNQAYILWRGDKIEVIKS